MKLKKLGCVSMVCCMVSSGANAGLLGVEDMALLAKSAEQVKALGQQLEKMKQSYKTALDQYATTQSLLTNSQSQLNSVKNLVEKNSGSYGFGSKLNDLNLQKWSPSNWKDALKGASGSGNSVQYQALLNAYKKSHKSVDIEDLKTGASADVVKDYEMTKSLNEAAGVQSEYAFNEVDKSLERIHKLSTEIDKAENTKAAIDLNSRIMTEVAYLQTQNLKAQSITNQQMAQTQAVSLSERAKTSKFLAFDDDY